MSNKLYEESNIMEIANAIRTKGGTTTLLKVSDMAQAIADIPTSGTPTIESLTVTQNGTYTASGDVDGYSPVSVNVPQGYLCKITRYFDEDTACNTVQITHNIGNTNYYSDVYVDEVPTPTDHVVIINASSQVSNPDDTLIAQYLKSDGTSSSTRVLAKRSTETTFTIYSSSYYYRAGHTYTFYFYAKGDVEGLPTVKLQDKSVTTNGNVTADSEYNGLNSVNVSVPQGYLCKISRTFTEDTACNEVSITHNIGNINFYVDAFIDEIPDPVPSAPSMYYVLSASSCAQPNFVICRAINASGNITSTVCNQAVNSTTFKINANTFHYIGGHTYTFYFYVTDDVEGLPTVKLQDKSVTVNDTVTADSGYNGLGSVNVNVPQGYLCKISRTFSEDTKTTDVSIFHNLNTLDYYADVYIDDESDILPSDTRALLSASNTTVNTLLVRTLNADGTIYISTTVSKTQTSTSFSVVSNMVYLAGHTYTFYFYAKNDTAGLPTLNLQNKTITENGVVTPDSGYTGLSSVNVSVQQGELLPESIHTGTFEVASNTNEVTIEHGFDTSPRFIEVWADEFANISTNYHVIGTRYDYVSNAWVYSLFYYINGAWTSTRNNACSVSSNDTESVITLTGYSFRPNYTYRWHAYL